MEEAALEFQRMANEEGMSVDAFMVAYLDDPDSDCKLVREVFKLKAEEESKKREAEAAESAQAEKVRAQDEKLTAKQVKMREKNRRQRERRVQSTALTIVPFYS